MIPYGPFRPDVGGPGSGVAMQAVNVVPQAAAGNAIGYGPYPQLITAAGADALSAAPRGAISVIRSDGTYETYFGTATTIEKMGASYGYTSIDTDLSVTTGDDISFARFGSYLVNTNTTDGIKAYNVELGGDNDAVSAAPKARFIFTISNVLVALDCDGNNRRMESSGLGDHTEWSKLGANGKTFEDGGKLVAGCDLKGGNGLVLQENALRLMTFGGAGTAALYSLTKIADGKGCVGARSVISFDGVAFYLGSDDFYRFDLNRGNVPIGAEKIARWFFERVDQTKLDQVQGAVDPLRKIVVWRYPVDGETTIFANAIGYSWQLNEWFALSVQTAILTRLATPGYTLDDMGDFGVVDDIDIPLDSRFWQGGQPVFAGLDADLKFATFSGPPMAATLETAPQNSPVSGAINRATLIDDCTSGTLALGTGESTSGTLAWGQGAERSTRTGRVPLRGRGRNIAFRRVMPAGAMWTYANGVDHLNK